MCIKIIFKIADPCKRIQSIRVNEFLNMRFWTKIEKKEYYYSIVGILYQ